MKSKERGPESWQEMKSSKTDLVFKLAAGWNK